MNTECKHKRVGFWLAVLLLPLCGAMALVYGLGFWNSPEFSWFAWVPLVLDLILGLVLLALRRLNWFPMASFFLLLLTLLFSALALVNYVANAVIGIDSDGVGTSFIVWVVLLAVSLLVNWFALGLKQAE